MKLNQKGLLDSVLIVLAVVVLVAAGVYLSVNLNNDDQMSTNVSEPENSGMPGSVVEAGQIRIFGESVFIVQGPNDAPIGERPAAATLLVGSEADVRSLLLPRYSDSGNNIIDYGADKTTTEDSSMVRLITANGGDYEVGLNPTENMICLVQEQQIQEINGDILSMYILPFGSTCVTVDTTKNETQIDIGQIGFGGNTLSCKPSSDCREAVFEFN